MQFLKINISQGSVATPVKCAGICNDHFIVNFLLSVSMKEFKKSVNICRRYKQDFDVSFFDSRCSLDFEVLSVQ